MKTETVQHSNMRLMRVVMFTLVLSSMSAMMFNFVLPQISAAFSLSTAQVSWVTSSYSLIYGIGAVIYGKLADRFKLKHLLTFGLSVLAVGSLCGLLAQAFWMVLVARCLQAIGAATIPATAMLIPIRYFAPEQRGSATSMAFVGLALGGALGPVISASIISFAHWRWLFCIPLLLLLTLPFYRKYLHEEQHAGTGGFDWIGGGLLAVTVTSLLLGITNAAWWFALCGILALALLIIRIRSVPEPFVQPRLFTDKRYTLRLVIAFFTTGMGMSFQFLSPLLLAQVQQLPPNLIGFALVPAAAASALLGRKGGKLADAKGASALFYTASGLLLSCFALLSTFTGISPVFIAVFLILGNVGQTFLMIALSNSISLTLDKRQAGVGMGLLSMLNFISGGMASGIYGKLVDIGSHGAWNPLAVYADGVIFSNIFFALAVMHAGILLFYKLQFGKASEQGNRQSTGMSV